MFPLRRFLALAFTLYAVFAVPASALAQSSPFAPIPQAAPEQQPVPAPVSNPTTSDDGLSTGDQILIFGGGVILITAIVGFIYRDARRRAPLKAGETVYDERETTQPHRKKTQSRAKAKRAKAARKRNR